MSYMKIGAMPMASSSKDGRDFRLSYRHPTGGFVKSILDPSFRYVPSSSTDLRKTFARVREEMRKADAARETRVDVVPLLPTRDRRPTALARLRISSCR
jgi:hypothetical protein